MNRRGFFKMMGGLAALVLSPIRPATKPYRFGAASGNFVTGESFVPGLRKEFAEIYKQKYVAIANRVWLSKTVVPEDNLKGLYCYYDASPTNKIIHH